MQTFYDYDCSSINWLIFKYAKSKQITFKFWRDRFESNFLSVVEWIFMTQFMENVAPVNWCCFGLNVLFLHCSVDIFCDVMILLIKVRLAFIEYNRLKMTQRFVNFVHYDFNTNLFTNSTKMVLIRFNFDFSIQCFIRESTFINKLKAKAKPIS